MSRRSRSSVGHGSYRSDILFIYWLIGHFHSCISTEFVTVYFGQRLCYNWYPLRDFHTDFLTIFTTFQPIFTKDDLKTKLSYFLYIFFSVSNYIATESNFPKRTLALWTLPGMCLPLLKFLTVLSLDKAPTILKMSYHHNQYLDDNQDPDSKLKRMNVFFYE